MKISFESHHSVSRESLSRALSTRPNVSDAYRKALDPDRARILSAVVTSFEIYDSPAGGSVTTVTLSAKNIKSSSQLTATLREFAATWGRHWCRGVSPLKVTLDENDVRSILDKLRFCTRDIALTR